MSIDRWNPFAGPSRRQLSDQLDDLAGRVADLECMASNLQSAITSIDQRGGELIVELREDIAQLKSSQDAGAPVSNIR